MPDSPAERTVQPSADDPKLSAADQASVDQYLRSGSNSVERKPFRPWLLLVVILVVMTLLSLLSYWIARFKGVV